MNCEAMGDELMDLLYDELPPRRQAALEAHMARCEACRTEWAKLRAAHGAVAAAMAGAPAGASDWTRLQEEVNRADTARLCLVSGAGGHSRRVRLITWFGGVGAAAAAAAILLMLLLPGGERNVVVAEDGPPVIKKVNVSLTILSQPEGWSAPRMQRAEVQQGLAPMTQMDITNGTSIAYGGRYWGGQPMWMGMALVRDQRLGERLPKGRSQVRFTDVPTLIHADSVRLRNLENVGGLSILEQNYQYDLASAAAVTQKHIDKGVSALFKDGNTVSGTLLSADGRTLVVRLASGEVRNVARQELRAVTFEKLPAGLLTRPTLVWEVENTAAATRQPFEVAYLTGGLTWRADYVLRLQPRETDQSRRQGERREGDGKEERSSAPSASSAIEDSCDLVGYATVSNFSGVTFEDAQLKLMAGDVNVVKPEMEDMYPGANRRRDRKGGQADDDPQMQEKSFFEYHLYTLQRPTTIANAEVKQIEMVSGAGVRLRREYVYDPGQNATAARVVSVLDNRKENGLGKPLPKGVVRLYAPDPEGVQTYASQTRIDHTPKDEKLRLPWGYAFDIACSRKETRQRRSASAAEMGVLHQVRNHKGCAVPVTVIVRVPVTTYEFVCSQPWHVREVGLVEVDVTVGADETRDVEVTYKWDDKHGGGLKSPEKR
jgi:hypothetical protein